MEIIIDIPEHNPKVGFEYRWEDGFEIETRIVDGGLHMVANKKGLLSLANHLLSLAQDAVPSGTHLHLDEYNSLEEGSCDMIIEKK
jgi:hypothetical protein